MKKHSKTTEEEAYTQLLKATIENHPRVRIIPYFIGNDADAKEFSQIKRGKWTKKHFTLIGEWSQSPMHSGNLTFIIKSTQDKKHWALFLKGSPSRIYAVAKIVDEGNVVMERVAAGMMSLYTKYESGYVGCMDKIGQVNFTLLYDLYDHFNEELKNEGL